MALSRLGEFIQLVEGKNNNGKYGLDRIKGISTKKTFISTKADMEGIPLTGYKIVFPFCFAYVADTSRRGERISLAFNNSEEIILVSSITTIFQIKPEAPLLPNYLYLFFNRPEFDRYSRFNSWGSAREAFGWDDMCNIELVLPSIEMQQKAVDVYLSMVANQNAYEKGLEELKVIFEGKLEQLRKNSTLEKLDKYLDRRNIKNTNLSGKYIGVGSNGLIPPKQELSGENILNKKIFKLNDFIFTPSGICAYNEDYEEAVCSHVNEVFFVRKKSLNEKYLYMWLSRSEFIRYSNFNNISSVMTNFNSEILFNYKIPIPLLSIQNSIVEIFTIYKKRRDISENLKKRINDLCPILIKRSLI